MSEISKKRPNEIEAWTVAVGNLPTNIFQMFNKRINEAIKYISGLEGFIGFHPHYPDGTLCLFRSKNQAIRAKNLMESKGIRTGHNICMVYVDKMFLKENEDGYTENPS